MARSGSQKDSRGLIGTRKRAATANTMLSLRRFTTLLLEKARLIGRA